MIIFAYIDPGSGLLAWQAIVAAVLGAVFYLKKSRAWVVRQMRRLLRTNKPTQPVTSGLACDAERER